MSKEKNKILYDPSISGYVDETGKVEFVTVTSTARPAKYAFSKKSRKKLATCHEDLQRLFNEVIKEFDCTILFGHRTQREQMQLFKRGRKKVNGEWIVVNKKEIVTYKDGDDELSKHNKNPSDAVDATPYPIDWKNTDRMYFFCGYVKRTAEELGINIRQGCDWDSDTLTDDQKLIDLPHCERA